MIFAREPLLIILIIINVDQLFKLNVLEGTVENSNKLLGSVKMFILDPKQYHTLLLHEL